MSAIHSSNRWTEVAVATVVSCIEASGLQPGVERGRREESMQFPKHVPAFSEIGDLMPHTFLCPKPPEYLWLINAINLRLKISWRQLPFMAEFQISHTPCTAISFLPQYKFFKLCPMVQDTPASTNSFSPPHKFLLVSCKLIFLHSMEYSPGFCNM